jgi:hypothetical protein
MLTAIADNRHDQECQGNIRISFIAWPILEIRMPCITSNAYAMLEIVVLVGEKRVFMV